MGLWGNWRIRKAEDDGETVYIAEKFGVRLRRFLLRIRLRASGNSTNLA